MPHKKFYVFLFIFPVITAFLFFDQGRICKRQGPEEKIAEKDPDESDPFCFSPVPLTHGVNYGLDLCLRRLLIDSFMFVKWFLWTANVRNILTGSVIT